MTAPRYDMYDGVAGGFRAPLAAALPFTNGSCGPIAVSLNASGQVVVGTNGQSGMIGVLVKNVPNYPNLGSIIGQPNINVPIGGAAGNVVDVMTSGTISDPGSAFVAGQRYFAASDGTLTTNPADGPPIGWTVQANRLIVRTGAGATPNTDLSGQTANSAAVANTVVETPLMTYGLDAGEVQAGSVYELRGWGVYSNTGTPTLLFGIKLGGIAGTLLVATPAIATVTASVADAFQFEGSINFHSATKAVAKLRIELATVTTDADATIVLAASNGEVTVSTAAATTLGVDVTWGTASASNTLQLQGGYAKRVA